MTSGMSSGLGHSPELSAGFKVHGLDNSKRSSVTTSLVYRFQYDTIPVSIATKNTSATGKRFMNFIFLNVKAHSRQALINRAPYKPPQTPSSTKKKTSKPCHRDSYRTSNITIFEVP